MKGWRGKKGLAETVREMWRAKGGEVAGGHLNPEWLEWYMGFPEQWTGLQPLETPSSRWLRRWRSEFSRFAESG